MRVIIVEDSPVVREGLAQLIDQEEGVTEVATASSVEGADGLLSRTAFDLWVLDFDLGDGTALDLLERKRSEGWPGTVAVLTKHSEEPIRDRCLEAGANCFYDKTGDLDRALTSLRSRIASASPSGVDQS